MEILKLDEEQREILLEEVLAAAGSVRDTEARRLYAELTEAVDLAEVPSELWPALETLLAVGLDSGRIRRVHLAEGETILSRLYSRLPGQEGRSESLRAMNEALRALVGEAIRDLRISAQGPSGYTLEIETDLGRVRLVLDRGGARLQTLEV